MNELAAVREAARNNAEWCDAFCRTHGIDGEFSSDCWWSRTRTPPLYPDAVTLAPEVEAADLLARIDTGGGCSVKDSFATLALDSFDFRPMSRAEWVVSETESGEPNRWSAIETTAQLEAWEAAWGEAAEPGFFRPELLLDPAIAFFGHDGDGGLRAGAIANRGPTAIGISNLFDTTGDLTSAWRCAAATARARWGSMPVVGYDSGSSLHAAHRAGFRSVGDLTVWARPASRDRAS
ncbi:MAG TPA: hypothetical protein VLK36_13310 [Gaiellaceae bacterium]|nr:hypothetical protein [Gaiellaceae bacterium]